MPAGASPRLVLYRGVWCVYHHRRRVSTGSESRPEAERFLADYIAATERPPPGGGLTVAAILTTYLKTRAGRPGADRLGFAHKPLIRMMGDKPADKLTDTDIAAYAAQRAADGVADGTARTELQALRAALRWKYAGEAPQVPLPPRSEARDRWLTRDEAARLLAACERPHIRLFILLGLHTAARSGAILGLTWERVDLVARRVDYREPGALRSKKRRVAVPINDILLPALIAAKERATTPYVIEFAGQRVARVKTGLAATGRRAKVAGVTPHVLRHTAATWMMQAGVSAWEVAGLMGHSNVQMIIETYGHHDPEHLKNASDALAG